MMWASPMYMKKLLVTVLLGCLFIRFVVCDDSCVAQEEDNGIVCVCNSTYCDNAGTLPDLESGQYAIIMTTESGLRLNVTTGLVETSYIPHDMQEGLDEAIDLMYEGIFPTKVYIGVDSNTSYQQIEGFGGAFTDAAGINFYNISSAAQEYLLRSFFGSDGLDYNLGRVPIGGTDFSTHAYAYNEYPVNDTKLSNFTLAEEDFNYKIPFIQRAKELVTDELRLLASLWSPPLWMKTNGNYTGVSKLKEEFYATYALYHLKFLEEYKNNDIDIWAITSGNEPIDSSLAYLQDHPIPSLGWSPANQSDWIVDHLGPTIKENANFSETKIFLVDDQTPVLEYWLPLMVDHNEDVLQYMDGIGTHWYIDRLSSASILDEVRSKYPNTTIFNTEASLSRSYAMGNWSQAENYLDLVFNKLNHSVNGWLDWNLVLNIEGGPTWINLLGGSLITVDAENDQFFKQPTYYCLGHLSKYVPRGSVRIESTNINDILHVAFQRPDGLITVVALNNESTAKSVILEDKSTNQIVTFAMEAHSIATVVYSQ